MSYFRFSVLFGSAKPTYGSIESYYILLLMLLAIIQVDIGVNYVNRKIRERMIRIARSIKRKLQTMRKRPSTDSEYKPSKKRARHHGFAFAQEPGNAPQVVNKVKRDSLTLRKSVLMKNNFSLLEDHKTKKHMGRSEYTSSRMNQVHKSVDIIQEESDSGESKKQNM